MVYVVAEQVNTSSHAGNRHFLYCPWIRPLAQTLSEPQSHLATVQL